MNPAPPAHIVFLHIHVDSILLWGFAATVIVTTIMYASQALGFSRMSFPLMLGTIFTANRDRAQIVGFVWHFIAGWILAFVYAMIFESLRRVSWWLGMGMGLIQGIFVLAVVMLVLPYAHPRMATEYSGPDHLHLLEPPGFLALNYGRRTPFFAMIAHAAYGTVLGAFYQLVG
ncbi:MAG TPA: hypothetical protein VLS90_08560 [Thermodesulfobacteriota bacterium]|nr:hypothetical protein [Thermodesulfobacteriota bacterium]